MASKIFDQDDFRVAFQIERDLENPESGLNHLLQSLAFKREGIISQISKAKKESEPLMKLVGELKAISDAINKPHEIVSMAKSQQENEKNQKEVNEILEVA